MEVCLKENNYMNSNLLTFLIHPEKLIFSHSKFNHNLLLQLILNTLITKYFISVNKTKGVTVYLLLFPEERCILNQFPIS